jgi:hypothetical protein
MQDRSKPQKLGLSEASPYDALPYAEAGSGAVVVAQRSAILSPSKRHCMMP